MAKQFGIDQQISANEMGVQMILGPTETVCSYDTYQFDDYSKVVAPRWDPEQKAKRRAEVFPIDCGRAFEMGARLARQSV